MFAEGTAINLSLNSLGNCIKALSERKEPNYRESKLTLLLKPSMTNGRVVMIGVHILFCVRGKYRNSPPLMLALSVRVFD